MLNLSIFFKAKFRHLVVPSLRPVAGLGSRAAEPADPQVAEAAGAVASSAPRLGQAPKRPEQVPPGQCTDAFPLPGRRAACSLQSYRALHQRRTQAS
jgi:hypothetical protein